MIELSKEKPSLTRQITFDVLALALPIFGLLPMLLMQVLQLWEKSYGGFLPLCWLCLALIVYFSPKSMTTDKSRVFLFMVFFLISLVVGVGSVIRWSPWAANVALATLFIGWGLIRLTSSTIARILGLSTLVLISLPLPGGIDSRLTMYGDDVVANTFCSPVLDVFEKYHLYKAPNMLLKNHTINVYDLLGNSLNVQSMVAVAILISLILRRSLIATLFTIVSAGIWAMFGRFVYLFIVAYSSEFEIDLSQHFMGSVWLAVVAIITILLIIASDAFWGAIFSPIRIGGEAAYYRSTSANIFNRIVLWPGKLVIADHTARPVEPLEPAFTYSIPDWLVMPIGIVMAALIFPASYAIIRNDLIFNKANYYYVTRDRIPEEETLAKDFFEKQTRKQFKSNASLGLGAANAKTFIWSFSGSGVDTILILKYPVRGWDPSSYNLGPGWKVIESNDLSDSEWHYSENLATAEGDTSAIILSSQMETDGRPFKPTDDEMKIVNRQNNAKAGWFDFRILDLLNPKQETLKPQTIAIQVRYSTKGAISDNERKSLRAKFLEARKLLTDKLLIKTAENNL